MTGELEAIGINLAELGVPAAGLTAGALALRWLAGPSLKEVGRAFGELTYMRTANILGIGERASKRLEPVDDGKVVPPQVLYRVLEDGSWASDPLAQEYFAGMLLGSRTDFPHDHDNGAARWAAKVATMSRTELRVHWVTYRGIAEAWYHYPKSQELQHPGEGALFERASFGRAVGGSSEQIGDALGLLHADGLLRASSHLGGGKYRADEKWGASAETVSLKTSSAGTQLFSWAVGCPGDRFFDLDAARFPADLPYTAEVVPDVSTGVLPSRD